MKKSIVLATAVASVLTSGIAAADLTANAGAFSNYIFRGATLSGDNAAVQGGIDWSADSGVYVGTWVSTLGGANQVDGTAGGNEIDVYAGFSGEAGNMGYDLGVLTYQYTATPEFNYTELYASGTLSIVTVGFAYTVDSAAGNKDEAFDSGDIYLHGSADFAAGPFDVSLYAGSYQFTNDGEIGNDGTNNGSISYNHFGVSLGKDGFGFAIDKNDQDEDLYGSDANDVRFTVSFAQDFQL